MNNLEKRQQAFPARPGAPTEESEPDLFAVGTVIRFLEENEQYGDDWQTEIEVLRSLVRTRINDEEES